VTGCVSQLTLPQPLLNRDHQEVRSTDSSSSQGHPVTADVIFLVFPFILSFLKALHMQEVTNLFSFHLWNFFSRMNHVLGFPSNSSDLLFRIKIDVCPERCGLLTVLT